MLVFSKRNIRIPAPDGSSCVELKRDGMTQVPDWVVQLPYFAALVKDGKVVVSEQTATTSAEPEEQKKKKTAP